MKRLIFLPVLLCGLLLLVSWRQSSSGVYKISKGSVHFKSDAPLELIEAKSKDLRGLIDFGKETFAFSVKTATFEGFNSDLQKEHFNENYMESNKFQTATFSGKIIDTPDITKDGEYTIRAKGKLLMHGVEQERIIKSTVRVKGDQVAIKSNFTVALHEHNITIPKVVHQKIAEEIHVEIDALAEKS